VNSRILLAASLCASAWAQGRTFDGLEAPRPTPGTSASMLDGGGSIEHIDVTTPAGYSPRVRTAQGQDPDYTMRGLFQQHHGDFMLKRERYDPMIEFRGQALPHAEVMHEPGKMRLLNWSGDAELPFMVATDGYLTFGAYGGDRRYYTKDMPGFPDEDLYSAGIKAGFGVFLDENTLLEGLFTPGYFSDLDSTLTRDDVKLYGKVLVTYRADEGLFFKFGARYNDVYADYNTLPYLGVSWQVTESFRVDVLLPEKVEISLWPSADFGFLLGSEIQGSQYHVRASKSVREATPSPKQEANVHVQEVIVYAGALWRFTEYTSLITRVGAVVAGDYKLDDGDTSTAPIKGSLETGMFFEATFGIDF